jgi:hypothetical protein
MAVDMDVRVGSLRRAECGNGFSWLSVAMDLAREDMQAQSTGTVPNTQDEWIVEVQEG